MDIRFYPWLFQVRFQPYYHLNQKIILYLYIISAYFLFSLEKIIADRKNNPTVESYTSSLFKKGINKIAQKVGEEATEVVIEAIDNNRIRLKEETADLFYHLLVLLQAKDIPLSEINEVLEKRHK